MKLKDADKFDPYPDFKSWLLALAKRIRNNQKVLNALTKFSKLTESQIYSALELSKRPPSLDLNTFWHPKGWIKYSLAIYHNGTDMIILNKGMIELFEKDPSWGRVIEASILHELVHRGLMKAKDPNAEHDDDERDQGKAFERAAYGEVVEATCSQKIELRRVTGNWKPDVNGVYNFYDYQCGLETPPGKSRINPY